MTDRPPKRRPTEEERPAWADANGYVAVRQLDDELWLVTRPMVGDIQLAVCTPPPSGGILEFWDYDADAAGAMASAYAFSVFPHRDMVTEDWNRHVHAPSHTDERRRSPHERSSPPCYLNIEQDDDGWSTGSCDCGQWQTPMGCPGPEEVANAWGDHLQSTPNARVGFR